MQNNLLPINCVILLAVILLVTGCTSASNSNNAWSIDFRREAIDEFLVISNPPLQHPPNYNLKPPVTRSEVPLLFNNILEKKAQINFNISEEERILLGKFGYPNYSPDIRNIVDKELKGTFITEENIDELVQQLLVDSVLELKSSDDNIAPYIKRN